MPATQSCPGATVIGADALKPPPVAVTIPLPPFAPAVKFTVEPDAGWNFPSSAGATVQDAVTGTAFPYWSVPIADSGVEAPAATVRMPDVTFIDTGAPGMIVSDCVPLVTPKAEAVI